MRYLVFGLLIITALFAHKLNSKSEIPTSGPVIKNIALQQDEPPNVYSLPVPAPDATNEPLSQEDAEYLNEVNENALVLDEAINKLLILITNPDIRSNEWQNELTYVIGQVSAVNLQIKKLRPPARYIGLHREYVDICNQYYSASYTIMQGLKDGNANTITHGVELIYKANSDLRKINILTNNPS